MKTQSLFDETALDQESQNTHFKRLCEKVQTCTACPLAKAQNPPCAVVASGNLVRPSVMIIGAAPSVGDTPTREAFTGPIGVFLKAVLQKAGIRPETLYYTTLVHCRPPARDPLEEELSKCDEWLKKEIKLVQPQMVLGLGQFVSAYALQEPTIDPKKPPKRFSFREARGRWGIWNKIPFLPTHAPSRIIAERQEPVLKQLKREFWEDLKVLRERIESL